MAPTIGIDRAHWPTWREGHGRLRGEHLEAVADRGYFNGEEILACEEAGITVTLPKPQTSGAKSDGRFGKQDFRYCAEDDMSTAVLAGEKLTNSTSRTRNIGLVHAPLLDQRAAAPAR